MKLTLLNFKNIPIAILESIDAPISSLQDALDLISDADYHNAQKIMIKREHLGKDFFNIDTKLAANITEKMREHYKYLMVVGDFSDLKKRSWLEFMQESNKEGQIMFAEDTQEAVKIFTRD
ncbi:MAG: DUF4180 domain-containing protein [Candidatus Neomarinimicrobiota bacterium]